MSNVMPGLISINSPTIDGNLLGLDTRRELGLESGLLGGQQFRKEITNLKVPIDDSRYDSGIDSFKESDLQILRDEAEAEQNEQLQYSNSSSTVVAERLNHLNLNDDQTECCEEEEQIVENKNKCDTPACQCLTEDAFNQDEEGDTPLHSSIIHTIAPYARKFISCAPRVQYLSIQNKLRQTPMHLSVIMGQEDVLRQLVVAGASLEIQDQNGQTALHIACKYKHINCVRLLTQQITDQERWEWPGSFIEQPIPQNLEIQNFEGYTCWHLASFSESYELLQYLKNLGSNINARDGKSGRTALHHAIEQGRIELVRYLVQSLNADVDVLTFDHCTPLHLAVSRNFGEAITVLMDANADRSITNSEGLKADQFHL